MNERQIAAVVVLAICAAVIGLFICSEFLEWRKRKRGSEWHDDDSD